jgi:signal transduction histidine kinase
MLCESNELIQGFQEMFAECLVEMREANVSCRQADKLASQAVQAHSRYFDHKLLNDSLTDEIRDIQCSMHELCERITEYKEMLDYQRHDFDTVFEYVDMYYNEQIEAMKSNTIAKHNVPNRSGKGK